MCGKAVGGGGVRCVEGVEGHRALPCPSVCGSVITLGPLLLNVCSDARLTSISRC